MIRRSEIVLLGLLSIAAPAAAQNADTGLPPLIDRELFFGDPELAGATISPDGTHIAFLKPYEDVRNVWVKRTEEPFDAARPVTADRTRPIPQFFWSRDGRYVLYVQDRGGDENFNLYAVDPTAEPAAQGVPPARNLTEAENVRVALYALPKDRPDTAFIGLNDRDPAWHDLYELTISTGERTLLRENTERISGWIFDLEGDLRLAVRSPPSGETEILRVDEDGFTPLYVCGVFETCNPARFHPDGERVYMVTNRGDDVNLVRLTLLDVESGNETPVESDPANRVDLAGAIFSDRTDELVGTVYVDDRPRIYWRNDEWEADYASLRERLPGLDVSIGSSTLDERAWIVDAAGDVEPGETYLFDRETDELTLQYRIRERLPREHLAPMMPIRYQSADGLEIPAYLTLPKGGADARSLPVVIVPHGGPWGRDSWGYRPIPQFFANRGFAVLQPNFRGSAGFGKAFLDAGNGEWGRAMQADITAGVEHLIEEGIADPERVGIFGISYGGYAVLAGLAFTPDLYAAGVSYVGPSNLLTLLDSIPPYWEAQRTMLHERVGDPSDPEDRERLIEQSPLFSADRIRAPLLVIQGANDPRVKKAESEQIVVALRERGFPVVYLLAPDEGHGFARPVNNLAAFAATERFLAMHLDGRAQEGGSPEVMQRLEEITVDPATVELPAELAAPPSAAGSSDGP